MKQHSISQLPTDHQQYFDQIWCKLEFRNCLQADLKLLVLFEVIAEDTYSKERNQSANFKFWLLSDSSLHLSFQSFPVQLLLSVHSCWAAGGQKWWPRLPLRPAKQHQQGSLQINECLGAGGKVWFTRKKGFLTGSLPCLYRPLGKQKSVLLSKESDRMSWKHLQHKHCSKYSCCLPCCLICSAEEKGF